MKFFTLVEHFNLPPLAIIVDSSHHFCIHSAMGSDMYHTMLAILTSDIDGECFRQ